MRRSTIHNIRRLNLRQCSFDDGTLVHGHEVLDIDEGVFASVSLERLQRLQDDSAKIFSFPLSEVDTVTQVLVLSNENVDLTDGRT